MATRVETHQIKRSHHLFDFCNDITYKSKNLYNAVLYRLIKKYEKGEKILINHSTLYKNYKHLNEFKELGSAFANLTIKKLSKDYKSFFKNIKRYKEDKSLYEKTPQPPDHKVPGEKGRFQAMAQVSMNNDNEIKIPNQDIHIDFIQNTDKNIKQIQIEPSHNRYHRNIYFLFKIIYEKEVEEMEEEVKNIAGIDLNKGNLVVIATNIKEKPIAINGDPLCSMGDYYLKKRKKLMKNVKGRGTSNRIKKLDKKYTNKVKNYIHNVSRIVADWCKDKNIDTIVIGKNKNWKKEINLGHRNNYHFTIIPFNMLIQQIEYKAGEYGIKVELVEESYTSKASFLDGDELPKYNERREEEKDYQFSGKRIERGLYKTSNGNRINADVNGAYNIIKKLYPDKIDNDIKGELLHPQKSNIH